MHFIGNQILEESSVTQIEISGTQNDLVNIDGSLEIRANAELDLVILQPGALSEEYLIFTATDGVNGEFASPTVSAINIATSLLYPGTSIILQLKTIPFAELVQEGNPHQVAKYIDQQNPDENSDLSFVIFNLAESKTIDQLRNALDQMHPAPLKGLALSAEAATLNTQLGISNHLLRFQTKDTCANYCPHFSQIAIWADFQYESFNQSKRGGNIGFKRSAESGTIGIEYLGCKNPIGIALSYDGSNVFWRKFVDKGKEKTWLGSVYGSYQYECFIFNGILTGGGSRYTEVRKIQFGEIDRKARAKFNGWELASYVDGSWLHPAGNKTILGLQGSIEYIYLYQEAYKEKGADSINLIVNSSSYHMLQAQIAIFLQACRSKHNPRFWYHVQCAYARQQRFSGRDYTCSFQEGLGTYKVRGIYPDRNLFIPSIGLTYIPKRKKGLVSLDYQAELGRGYNSQYIQISVSL